MAKIKVTSKCELYDGMSITFNAPCDCTEVDGLNVYYENTSQSFSFRDANGNDLSGVDNIFSEGSYVKAVLDTTRGYAYIQNGASNAHLEGHLNSILTDETKALYGLDADAVPDDAFKRIAQLYGAYGFDITLITSDGMPLPNFELIGLTNAARTGVAVTDEKGKCFAIAETPSPTVNIPSRDIIGLTDYEVTLEASDVALVTSVTIAMPVDTSLRLFRTSGTYTVLENRPVDICIVGGGASGSYSHTSREDSWAFGVGGGGGYVENIFGQSFTAEDNTITLAIGAGGARSSGAHNPGGETSVIIHGTTYTAAGATSNLGNGDGGPGGNYGTGKAGTNGKVRVFGDATLPLPGGGGGGCGMAGGKDFGSAGSTNNTPGDATGPGGGGGGGNIATNQYGDAVFRANGGKGGDGGLYIRVSEVTSA